MNVEYFREGLELISSNGMKLTPEQALLIENSLVVLQSENKFRNIFFWGKIDGIENDYFLAFGYDQDCLIKRKFFYSTNGHEWTSLPRPDPNTYEVCLYCTEMFIGDPTVYISVKQEPKFSIDEKQIILATESDVCKIKEEDRLATTVCMITEECALIPRGGLYKLIDFNVIYHPEFRGLTEIQATDLTNYQLYRHPKNNYNYNLLKRSDYNYALDFLDTIEEIIPENAAFAVNLENSGSCVIIKSLIWLGMNFFHKLYSRKHGFVYFGNGKKNLDLLFMLP